MAYYLPKLLLGVPVAMHSLELPISITSNTIKDGKELLKPSIKKEANYLSSSSIVEDQLITTSMADYKYGHPPQSASELLNGHQLQTYTQFLTK